VSSGIRIAASRLGSGLLLLSLFTGGSALASSRHRSVSSEVPLERCDHLFVVPVVVEGQTRTFLLDTGATTLVNSALFPPPANINQASGGQPPSVELSSIEGSKNVGGYFVNIKRLGFAGAELQHLSLSAIDLSKMRHTCDRTIEGILGSDVLERLGVVIDMHARVARLRPRAEDLFPEVRRQFDQCADFFNRGDGTFLREHMDADVRWFSPTAEIRGRDALLQYFARVYFAHHARFTILRMSREDFHLAGDSYSLTYEFRIDADDHIYQGRSMLFCHRKDGKWLIATVNNSQVEITPAGSSDQLAGTPAK
jgi:ketosteroid isomerase-like protein